MLKESEFLTSLVLLVSNSQCYVENTVWCVICCPWPLAPLAPPWHQWRFNFCTIPSTANPLFICSLTNICGQCPLDTQSMYGSNVSFFDQRLYGRTDCSLSKNDVHWKCQNVNMSKVGFLQLKTAGGQVSCPLRGGGLQYLQQMEHLRALFSQPIRNY